jgi:hypothetical protein
MDLTGASSDFSQEHWTVGPPSETRRKAGHEQPLRVSARVIVVAAPHLAARLSFIRLHR